MATSYEWTFVTGDLNLATPPPTSPLLDDMPAIDLGQIKVIPRGRRYGVDLTQEIDIIFPGPIDPNSINTDDILMSIEAVLGDPTVPIPAGLTPTVTINGSTLKIVISGWPQS
jgi:hypothetical protein